ncbi:MAG: hypothetical protein VKN33_06575 [Candidatus Sericytochromatia bacterium]|nr:hypothetical protein [Candidatus Sericytochromatia bacterium]
MTPQSFRTSTLRSSLALALLLVPQSVQAGTVQSDSRQVLGAPQFHTQADQLRIPVRGRGMPKFLLQKLASRQYVVDFSDCEVPGPRHSVAQPTESHLAGWSMAKTPHQPNTRLRLTMRDDTPPQAHFDPTRHEVILSFASTPSLHQTAPAITLMAKKNEQVRPEAEVTQSARASHRIVNRPVSEVPLVLIQASDSPPRLKQPTAQERNVIRQKTPAVSRAAKIKTSYHDILSTAHARVGTPHFDRTSQQLVIPVIQGKVSQNAIKTYRLNKRWSYLDIEGTLPAFSGVRWQERPDFKFQRWVSAKRPQRAATRVSFASGVDVRLAVRTTPKAVFVRVIPTAVHLGTSPKKSIQAAAPKPLKILQPKAPRQQVTETKATHFDTVITRPYYDTERFGLVFPYEGRLPLFRYATKSDQKVVLELKASPRHPSHLQPTAVENAEWGSWKLIKNSQSPFLRLEFNFKHPSELSIAADPTRHHLVLIPHPRTKRHIASHRGTQGCYLSPVALDQREENLFIPYTGSVPQYSIERVTPTYVNLIFSAANLREAGVQLHTTALGSPLKYALLSQPAHSTVRLAVSLTVPAEVKVFQDASHSRLVVALNRHAEPAGEGNEGTLKRPAPWPHTDNTQQANPLMDTNSLSRRP